MGSGIHSIFGYSARTAARRSDGTCALPEHRHRRRAHDVRDRSAHSGHRGRSSREVGPVPVDLRRRGWGYRALVAWRLSPTGATDSLLLDPMAGAAGSVVKTRRCVLFLGFAALAACSDAAPEAPMPADAAERIESALLPTFIIRGEPTPHRSLADRMDELGVPGVSVAVLADGEVGWARGYGFADVEWRRPVTANTLFQAASVSKPVAALAALQLVEEGRVDLDADVNTYLRSWLLPSNELTTAAAVTLRGLVTHRAGLSVSGFPGTDRTNPSRTRRPFWMAAATPIPCAP